MDNIWFYTLSTSAQVLAALAGLFAVFVVWKIQESEKYLSEIRQAVITMYPYLSANTRDYKPITYACMRLMSNSEILEKFSELLSIKKKEPERINLSQDVMSDSVTQYSLDEFTESSYRDKIDKKSSILSDLKYILIVNFVIISVCIIALTFSSVIYHRFILLVIISITVLYCLYLIGSGIYRITAK